MISQKKLTLNELLLIAAIASLCVLVGRRQIDSTYQDLADNSARAEQEVLRDTEIKDIRLRLMHASESQWEACSNAAGSQLANAEDWNKIELARMRRVEACVNQLKQSN